MRTAPPRLTGLISALLSAAVLGVAFASEYWGGLVPCALCLWERWPYRVAIALGLIAAVGLRPLVRPVLGLLVITLLVGVVLSTIHTGVEYKWWPSPLPECAAPRLGGGSIAERLAAMPARPAKPCDDPTFLIPFLPISMAEMNLLFSLGLACVVVYSLRRRPHRR